LKPTKWCWKCLHPLPACSSEILVADGGTVAAEQLIARIDTDGKAGCRALLPLLRQPCCSAPVAAAQQRQSWLVWPCLPPPN
jgi:hypothetical protein